MTSVSMPHSRNPSTSFQGKMMSGFLDKDYMYGVHITLDAGAVAFRWHQPTDTYETIDLSTVASNHLELPLHAPQDGHWDLAIGVDDQDNVFITGNHRPTTHQVVYTTHLLRCTNVQDFTNPASWVGEPTPHYDGLGDPSAGTTSPNCYHLFERMTDGTLLHFPSIVKLLGIPGRRTWAAFKRRGGVWTDIIPGGRFGEPGDSVDSGETSRIYVCSVLVEPRAGGDRVHAYGVWREAPGVNADTQKYYWYLYSDDPDLEEWRYLTTGAPGYGVMSMPMTWGNEHEDALITSGPDWTNMWRTSLYIDPVTDTPSVLIQDKDTGNSYRCYWVPGTGWDYEVISGFTKELSFKGQRYRRANGAGRQGLRDNSNNLVMLGAQIASVYNYTHDPIWLRERDVYAVCIGESNTPKVWTIGNGAKRHRS